MGLKRYKVLLNWRDGPKGRPRYVVYTIAENVPLADLIRDHHGNELESFDPTPLYPGPFTQRVGKDWCPVIRISLDRAEVITWDQDLPKVSAANNNIAHDGTIASCLDFIAKAYNKQLLRISGATTARRDEIDDALLDVWRVPGLWTRRAVLGALFGPMEFRTSRAPGGFTAHMMDHNAGLYFRREVTDTVLTAASVDLDTFLATPAA